MNSVIQVLENKIAKNKWLIENRQKQVHANAIRRKQLEYWDKQLKEELLIKKLMGDNYA